MDRDRAAQDLIAPVRDHKSGRAAGTNRAAFGIAERMGKHLSSGDHHAPDRTTLALSQGISQSLRMRFRGQHYAAGWEIVAPDLFARLVAHAAEHIDRIVILQVAHRDDEK